MQLESILLEIDESTQTVKTAAQAAIPADEISILIEKLATAADNMTVVVPNPQQQAIDKVAGAQILSNTLDMLRPENFKPMVEFLKKASASGHDPQNALSFYLERQGASNA